jgi:hypothetical protein
MKPREAAFFLVALAIVGLIYSGNFWKAVFWGLAIWGVIVLIRRYRNKPRSSGGGGYTANTLRVGDFNGTPSTPEEEAQALAEINGEKHFSRCYMDGLTEGEQEVAYVLAEGLSYKDYYIFNNIIVPSEHNGSSQIDHLVVSKFGVFVIESKDYNGWIFGSKDHEHWTQSLPGGNNKFQFPNPIRQNWSHIMSLKALLPFIPENAFYNIVVFTNSAEIKTEPIEDVVIIGDLLSAIQKHSDTPITEEILHQAIGKLSYLCQTADISPEQHLKNINLRHAQGA